MERSLKSFLFILIAFIFLLFPSIAYANGAGLPAFFKINNKLAVSNPLQTFGITSSTFLIPQDFAPENYLVNKPINFVVDETRLQDVIAPELLKTTQFSWEFGDGTKAVGLENSHTYSQIGSYILILTINIYSTDSPAPTQFVDSFLLNIIPEVNYKDLPQAIMKFNGDAVTDMDTREIPLDFSKQINFDASSSMAPNGISEYLWNFGDGQTGTKVSMKHQYNDYNFKTVVLRIKDKNGFISDSYAGLRPNTNENLSVSTKSQTTDNNSSLINVLILVNTFILLGIIIFIKTKKKSK
jgi:hypothetical protein